MKKVFISLIPLTLISVSSLAQPDTVWTRTFGGNADDESYCIKQTYDGGFIIAGYTYSFGLGDCEVYLVKADSIGHQEWYRTFGERAGDVGWSVQQTSDQGYIISGSTYSIGTLNNDVYLIKTDAYGNRQWYRTFGGSEDEFSYSVQQTSDGGYIITGMTASYGAGGYDVYLIKADSSGNQQWQKTFGGSNEDGGKSVQQTGDGGYIIAGYTESFGSDYSDVYLIKTDNDGDQEWYKTFNLIYDDYGYSVQQTEDGGYIISGFAFSYYGSNFDVYIIKTDANGNQQWFQTFGGSDDDYSYSVQQTGDNGYIIAGITYSFGAGNSDVYLIKTDANGNQQWQETFGESVFDQGYSVQQTVEGGYILAGSTDSYGAGGYDVYLIRLESETSVEDFAHKPNYEFSLNPAYPNPFNSSTTISFSLFMPEEIGLKIYNSTGQIVYSLEPRTWQPGINNMVWDAHNLSCGIYFLRLEVRNSTQKQKILLVK